MFNTTKHLIVISLASLLLTACGESNDTTETEVETPAAPEVTVTETTPQSEPADMTVTEGMTEEAAIAKFGQPALTQTRELDQLVVTHHEWETEKGLLSIQFQNGVAKFYQLTAK